MDVKSGRHGFHDHCDCPRAMGGICFCEQFRGSCQRGRSSWRCLSLCAVDSLRGWASHLESLIDILINVADAVPVQASIPLSCELLTGLLSGEEDELFAFLITEVDFRFLGEVITDHSVKDDKTDSEYVSTSE